MDFDFSTLITDRSASDLELLRDLLSTPMSDWTAEQLAAFNQAASKGAYNYTDLNRVTQCMDYINEQLAGYGYVTGYQKVVVHPEDPGSRLPEGYTGLQYIESTGTQRINTGIKPDGNTHVTVDIQISDAQITEGHLFSVIGRKYLDPYTWYEMDIPTYPQMQRYITNGKVLRETLALPESTAAMPEDMVGLTQEEANAIEGVLWIIEGWIHNMAAAWFYSGDLYAGEV